MRILALIWFSMLTLGGSFQPQAVVKIMKNPISNHNRKIMIMYETDLDEDNSNTKTETNINTNVDCKNANNSVQFDPIEAVGGFMGYPPEYKWKGVRVACYSIAIGIFLRDVFEEVMHPDAKFLEEFMNHS